MRAIIQRVKSASVTVDGKIISQIGPGLCVLIGISRDDTESDSDYITRKILKLCLFDDQASGRRWSASVMDRQLDVLCVSQFTLYAVLKGNRLDFHHSMEADRSRAIYDGILEKLRSTYQPDRIRDGLFGALMEVNIVNDGPVTIQLESSKTKTQSQES